jgi:SAM-dependent methyltransferase
MPGRRGIQVQDDASWIFNRLVEPYAFRPAYPDALIDRLVDIARAGRVADLGAGTGLLALPLARRSLAVAAVEPARRMLEALRAGAPRGVESVHAAAEDTGLPSGAFSLVLLADALHWVDPERTGAEIARLLAPGGACAVLEARFGSSPFMDGLASAISQANPKARAGAAGALKQVLSLALVRKPIWVEVFQQDVELDPAAVEGVVRSLSYVGPALSPADVDALVAHAQSLGEAHGARWRRELTLHWGRR